MPLIHCTLSVWKLKTKHFWYNSKIPSNVFIPFNYRYINYIINNYECILIYYTKQICIPQNGLHIFLTAKNESKHPCYLVFIHLNIVSLSNNIKKYCWHIFIQQIFIKTCAVCFVLFLLFRTQKSKTTCSHRASIVVGN